MPFVTAADGTDIFYKDWGAGPPVVLIHGWPVNADMWEYQAPVLAAQGFRVIAYDRRGFGRSSQPWSGYDYDTLADDLAMLLDKLDLRDAALVGFSMGGGEVVRYLARHGGARVAKAVLVSAVTPFLLKTPEDPYGADESVFDQMIEGLAKDRPHFLAGFGATFFGRSLLDHSVSDELLQWSSMMALQASPKATLDCVRAFSATDFRADLAKVAVPTLVVHGTADKTVPFEASGQRSAEMIAGAQLITYDGEPHGLFYTSRDRLNADLVAFIGS